MNYIGWLILFVVFAVLELISLGLTCIWFAVGALAGCITALIDNLNAKGQVSIDGMEWTARSEDGSEIKKDALVEVVAIEGVKAIVKQV